MEKLKPRNRKARSRLKKAAAVFALAAVSFLAGYANMKCERAERKPAAVETSQRNPDKNTETKAREVVTKLEKVLSAAARKKAEDERRSDEVLMKLVEEFPYESLDCKLLPRKEVNETSEGLRDASKTASEALSLGDDLQIWCRLGMPMRNSPDIPVDDPTPTQVEMRARCSTRLTEGIYRLKEENDLFGLASAVRYLDSLNLGEPSVSIFTNDLYYTYYNMYDSANVNSWDNAPGISCIGRIAYALRIHHLAVQALADLLPKNPLIAEKVLAELPDDERIKFLAGCGYKFFDAREFDRSSVEIFYDSLSGPTRVKFLAELERMDPFGDSVGRAEELAKYASDPELRKAMGRLAQRWKDQANSDKAAREAMKEESPEENGPAEI